MAEGVTFGRLLRARRRALDLTQEDLAHKVGYSVITIRKVESDERRPSRELVERLAASLNIPAEHSATFTALARSGPAEPDDDLLQRLSADLPTPAGAGPPSNLPTPLTRLIGRAAEVESLTSLLVQKDARLVTLVGPPGIGKSRLAVEVAAALRTVFPAGVFYVPLAAIDDTDLVPSAIAKTVGIRETRGQAPLPALLDYLRDRRMLLVLDDFEHLLGAAAMIAEILTACPAPTMLATSRAPLHIRGERLFRVPPLAADAAVELFVERAREVHPEFALSDANAVDVAGICADLDGLPLAIELVAARTRLMTLQDLVARLNHRLTLLTEGPRDAPAHQQTLRSTIDWSYNLLTAAEQAFLARLAVFVGGFPLGAAEEVVHALGELPLTVLDGLAALTDQNLLGYGDRADGERHFQFLAMIREYALERLTERGEIEPARDAWAAYYLRLAETANSHMGGEDQQAWLDRLDAAQDNLRAAVDWYAGHGAVEPAMRMVAALWTFWHVRSRQAEGLRSIGQVLALSAAPADRTKALALFGAGWIALDQSDHAEAKAYFEESLAIFRELRDARGIADALHGVGILAQAANDDAGAAELFTESLAVNRELGDDLGIAWSLDHLGNAALGMGDYPRSQRLFEESMALFRGLGHDWGIAISLHHQGLAAWAAGDLAAAHELFADGLALFRKLANRWGVAASYEHLGYVAIGRLEYRQAVEYFNASLTASHAAGDRVAFARCLAGLASVAVGEDDHERAAHLFAGAEAMAEAGGIRMDPGARSIHLRDVAAVRARLDDPAIAAAWASGTHAAMGQLLAYARGQ
jgi:predicted ATPase/transcriptional regulator with XRE-family HTH domain